MTGTADVEAIVQGVSKAFEQVADRLEKVIERLDREVKDLSGKVQDVDRRQTDDAAMRRQGDVEVRAEVQLLTHTIGTVRDLVNDLRKEQATIAVHRESMIELSHRNTEVEKKVEQVSKDAARDLEEWRNTLQVTLGGLTSDIGDNKDSIKGIAEAVGSISDAIQADASERKGMSRAFKIATAVMTVGGSLGLADAFNIIQIGVENAP